MYKTIQVGSVSQWVPAIAALGGVIVGALINHFLERRRNKEQMLFQARKDTYTKILVGMNSSFVPKDGMDVFIADPNFNSKIRLEIGELLSQGRLLAGETLSEKFRILYDYEMEIWKAVDNDVDTADMTNKRGLLAREIEALMKRELGVSES